MQFAYLGAVDGFSRKVVWLEVCRAKSNPMVVGAVYIRAVQCLELVPEMLRTDMKLVSWLLPIAH